MNDDQLTRELHRRADGVSLDADWTRRNLLPAVSSRIEAVPRDVAPARLPTLAGLAGVAAAIAALVVLVIAAPRPGPGSDSPPTTRAASGSSSAAASPTASFPVVLGAADFAARVTTGELDGETVVMRGRIERSQLPPGVIDDRYCGPTPDYYCFGDIVGSSISVVARYIAVADGELDPTGEDTGAIHRPNADWEWWDELALPPADGTLLLSVSESRLVEYLGQVDASDTTVLTSAGSVETANSDAQSRDQIRLVDGWLDQEFGLEPPCAAPNNYLPGLPVRFCNRSWVTDTPSGGPRLGVQDGAYHQFAADPTPPGPEPPEARKAVYAIAPRLEGVCPDDPAPCWQWEIVGRLDLLDELPVRSPLSSVPPGLRTVFECDVGGVSLSLIDATQLVTGCTGIQVDRHNPTGATNPSGDLKTVRLLWGTSTCNRRGTFELTAVAEGYELTVREPGDEPGCVPMPEAHAVDFYVSEPIPAASITVRVIRDGQEVFPLASPPVVSTTFECARPPLPPGETPPPGPIPRIVDESGLIESCALIDVLPELEGPISVSNLFELNTLEVVWQSGSCDQAIVFTFTAFPTGPYALTGERPSACDGAAGSLPISIRFSQPIPAENVHPSLIDLDAAGICGRVVSEFDLLAPTVVDETGLIESCTFVDLPIGRIFGIPVIDDVDDPVDLHLHVNWDANECSGADTVTFSPTGDRYSITLDRESHDQCKMVSRRRLMITLRQPVDVSLIDFSDPR